MHFKNLPLISTFIISITLLPLPETDGIANHAAYFLQDAQNSLCVTAGPIIDTETPSLFKQGIPIARNCTYGLDQQWVITNKDPENPTFYTLRSFNSKIMDEELNAKIKGEFISYFPSPVELIPLNNHSLDHSTLKEKDGKEAFLLGSKGKCFGSEGENHVVQELPCNVQHLGQHWLFTLVNQEEQAGGKVCSSFWSCNH